MTYIDCVTDAVQLALDLSLPDDRSLPAAIESQASLLALVSPEQIGADMQD